MASRVAPRRVRAICASFEQVLLYADGPQVVLLKMPGKSFIVGVCVDAVRPDIDYLGSRVSYRLLEAYLRNRCDLRYVMAHPDMNKHYSFSLAGDGSDVQLSTFEFDEARDDGLLPEHGLFASDHTEAYCLEGTDFNFVQLFLVDGKWDVQEFSKFNRNLSDLYALSRSVDRYEDADTSLESRRRIMESFMKPWRGGGSYLAFFTEISRAGGRSAKPEVDAIQWASPGHMDFLGETDSFAKIRELLQRYGQNRTRIDREYDALWKYLSEQKLLKAGRRSFDRTGPMAALVNERAKAFCRTLGMTSYRTLKKIAGNDPLIAAKVLLASSRRLSKMHHFFLEGRVSIEGERVG